MISQVKLLDNAHSEKYYNAVKMDRIETLPLLDLYSGLLTKTQQEICELYYCHDLGVSEIAAERGVSRQSVSDTLAICGRELSEFEKKLGFSRLLKETEFEAALRLADIKKWAESFVAAHPEFLKEFDGLTRLITQ